MEKPKKMKIYTESHTSRLFPRPTPGVFFKIALKRPFYGQKRGELGNRDFAEKRLKRGSGGPFFHGKSVISRRLHFLVTRIEPKIWNFRKKGGKKEGKKHPFCKK